jgi:uncharacterized protein DUF5069
MNDLSANPPRRWNETLAGYLWLPRLVDKIRAFQAGTLGAYAYPSYLDRAFLRQLALSPAFIERTVSQSETGEAIGRAVRDETGHTLQQIQCANESFERRWRFFLALMDTDEGHAKGPGYPIPQWLQPLVWRFYQRWAARKGSAQQL